MTRFDLATTIYTAPDVFLRVDGSQGVHVHVNGRVYDVGHHALGWLHAFRRPRPVKDALMRLGTPPIDREHLSDLLRGLDALLDCGALRIEPPAEFSRLPSPAGGYDSAFVHLTMLHDPLRKPAFVAAVRDVVEPGSLVLDLGTGSGVLAIAAAQAGARHVHAVEPSGVVHLAQRIAEANGVGDRITFHRTWSTELELDEPVDFILTDLVGNDALDMAIWETVHDARARLAAPGVKLLPAAVRVSARLVRVPERTLRRQRVTEATLAEWSDRLGMTFAPFRAAQTDVCTGFYERPEEVRGWAICSDASTVYELTLSEPPREVVATFALRNASSSAANALVLHNRIELAPGHALELTPELSDRESHWYSAVWLLPEQEIVRPGEEAQLTYRSLGQGHALVDVTAGIDEREAA